jgi:glycine/D-amino acid oxidase-like deaminating enzyme
MPQIQDLDAEDEDEQQQQQQAAKRARQQEPPATAGAAGAAAGAANGLPLSELPEVAAAMHNPGQLQVRAAALSCCWAAAAAAGRECVLGLTYWCCGSPGRCRIYAMHNLGRLQVRVFVDEQQQDQQ